MNRLLLGSAAIVGLWLIATDTGAQPQPQRGLKHGLVNWPHMVTGVGPTEKEAQQNAVSKAVTAVNQWLAVQDAPLSAWQVDEEYVRERLLDPGHAGDDVPPLKDGTPVKVWEQPLRDPDVSDLVVRSQRAQRAALSSERQTIAGYGLAALSMLLAVAWGYLRLDEWTGGRISTWLRVGAIAVIVAAALAWWMSA